MREEKKNSFNAPPHWRFRDRPLFFHPRGGCLPSSSSSVGVVVSGFQRVVVVGVASTSFFFFFFFFFVMCPLRFFVRRGAQKKSFLFFPKKKSPNCLGCGKLILRGTFLCVSSSLLFSLPFHL